MLKINGRSTNINGSITIDEEQQVAYISANNNENNANINIQIDNINLYQENAITVQTDIISFLNNVIEIPVEE